MYRFLFILYFLVSCLSLPSYTIQLSTQDNLEYKYHPVPSRTLRFKVKAANDAHVIFSATPSPSEADPVVEIFIGGWSNAKSAIRRDRTRPDKANVDTPGILDGGEFRGFWINYAGGLIEAGKENESAPFISFVDPNPVQVAYFGVSTGYGATGEWIIEDGSKISTHDNLEYTYRPAPRVALDIHVRCPHNAHIALTSGANDTSPMYEILLGGWENTASVIRYNKEKPDKVRVDTPGLLTPSDHSFFRISWDNGLVKVENKERVILEWCDPNPFAVTHFGVRTAWGSTGFWHIETTGDKKIDSPDVVDPPVPIPTTESVAVSWVSAAPGTVPPNAVLGGFDNENLFVGRAPLEGALIPGKVLLSHGVCYIPWGGAEHGIPEYEVLVGTNTQWVTSVDGVIPPNAIPGGNSEDGETLYIGRAQHEGTTPIGKVQPSHKVCYIPFGGQELAYPEYEILVSV